LTHPCNFENNFAPPSLASISSTVGMGWWCRLIALLRSLGSRHRRIWPLGFSTITKELTQSVGPSILSIASSRLFHSF
jgi:hypothetical protein